MFNSSSFIKKLIMILLFSQPIYAQSTLVTIAEDSYATSSSLANTEVFDFDNLNNGINYNVDWSGVGTFDQIFVANNPTAFGTYDSDTGLNTKYNLNARYGTYTTNLNLEQDNSYLGFYWAAGDSQNLVNFYLDNDLIASYKTQSLIESASLTSEYYGDPNFGTLSHEPYSFINFYGDNQTSWDRVEFTQTSPKGGFEIDNITVRTDTFNPETDSQEALGTIISEVSSTETTNVDTPSEDWAWAFDESAPGAPNPPFFALLFFLAAFIKTKFS